MKARIKNTPYIVDVEPFYLAVNNYDAAGRHPAHYNRFIGFIDKDKNVYERTEIEFSADLAEVEEKEREEKSAMPMLDTGMSVRAINCILAAFDVWEPGRHPHTITLGDVAKHSRGEYMRVRNFGKKSLNELEVLLEENGLKFAER